MKSYLSPGDSIRVQLRGSTDHREPIVEAIIVKGFRRDIRRVRVTTAGDWHNAELTPEHFRMVKEVAHA